MKLNYRLKKKIVANHIYDNGHEFRIKNQQNIKPIKNR